MNRVQQKLGMKNNTEFSCRIKTLVTYRLQQAWLRGGEHLLGFFFPF